MFATHVRSRDGLPRYGSPAESRRYVTIAELCQ